MADGAVIVNEFNPVHPFASVTVKSYVPPANPVKLAFVDCPEGTAPPLDATQAYV